MITLESYLKKRRETLSKENKTREVVEELIDIDILEIELKELKGLDKYGR